MPAGFTGDDACRRCHPGIFHEHAASRHAQTLRRMRPECLPRGFPRHRRFTDPSTGIRYTLTERAGCYTLAAIIPGSVRACPVDLVFGSGKSGLTFVTVAEPEAVRELRMSYFPARRAWVSLFGEQGAVRDPLGQRLQGIEARHCLSCHATALPPRRLMPEERFLGVGCEACHGPGGAHVTAALAGQPRRGMERLDRWEAVRLNRLCGRCHGSDLEVNPRDESALRQTARFQPYGLMLSDCFHESGGRLSCLSCHDPHENARTDARHYEAVCLSCHGGKVGLHIVGPSGHQAFGAERSRAAAGVGDGLSQHLVTRAPEHPKTVCPVNPRSGCTHCHMPAREVMLGVKMADHWIRVVQ
jgi:hypothetical protein